MPTTLEELKEWIIVNRKGIIAGVIGGFLLSRFLR